MATPEVKVEVAFTSGFATAAGARVWTDISQYVEGQDEISIEYGRSDEVSGVDPGKMSLLLDNRDGRFTPDRTSSPYYPNVQMSRPVRVSVRYDGVWSQRGLWYTDEWSLEWPDGSDGDCKVRLAASSRRARLGLTAPLPSAVREAILATNPVAYWPMSESKDVTTVTQRQAFRDITNPTSRENARVMAVFSRDIAWGPFVEDGTPGPPDEASLVFFPGQGTFGQLPAASRYIGAGSILSVGGGGSGELTVEFLARMSVRLDRNVAIFPVELNNATGQSLHFMVGTNVADEQKGIYPYMTNFVDEDTLIFGDLVSANDPATFARATDGEIHHFALTLTGGKTAKVWVDGIGGLSSTLTGGHTFARPFTGIIIGSLVVNSDFRVGHVAIHDRALTQAELSKRANAITSYDETLSERIVRVMSYNGVPADEVVVEQTVAQQLGAQSQQGRSAVEVLDEAATATGGIAFDDRLGRVYVRARNARYNSPVIATLSAEAQEVEADLGFVLDTRYLRNYIEVASPDEADLPLLVKDDASIAAYGRSADSIEIVSTAPTERESAAANIIYRQSQPRARIDTVSVELTSLSSAARQAALAVDISSCLALTDLPAQAPASRLELFAEGCTEEITSTSHKITFNTTPADNRRVWVLGDATLGALDATNRLAY